MNKACLHVVNKKARLGLLFICNYRVYLFKRG